MVSVQYFATVYMQQDFALNESKYNSAVQNEFILRHGKLLVGKTIINDRSIPLQLFY